MSATVPVTFKCNFCEKTVTEPRRLFQPVFNVAMSEIALRSPHGWWASHDKSEHCCPSPICRDRLRARYPQLNFRQDPLA